MSETTPEDRKAAPMTGLRTNQLAYEAAEPPSPGRGLGIASGACGLLFIPAAVAGMASRSLPLLAVCAILFPALAIALGMAANAWNRRSGRPPDAVAWGGTRLGWLELGLVLLFLLMPVPLSRASESANRVKCGRCLSRVGTALAQYALANAGRHPPDLATLVGESRLEPDDLLCPSSNTDKPFPATLPSATASAIRSNPRHCAYVYVGGGLPAPASAKHVLAYEPLLHHGDGMHVLYGDGRVRFLKQAAANHLLAEIAAGHNPPRDKPQ
jgi:hypothetical protein